MLSISPLGVTLLAVVASLFLVYRRRRNSRWPYPPGPKGYPVIGNVLDVPQGVPLWKAAMSMGEIYNSDVVYLNLLGADQIILNSNEAISDLLDKRSAIYSDRPRFPIIELMDAYSWTLPLVGYGDRWRSSRRLLHEFLSIRATNTYDDQQHYYSRDFLLRIAESPQDLWDHIKFTTGALIMSLTYGFDIKSHEDPFLAAAERALVILEEATVPGTFLVDTFPILKHIPSWLPGAKFKRSARAARNVFKTAVDGPLDYVKDSLKSGSARNASIASTCLDRIHDLSSRGFTEEDIRMITSSMYIAAVDTTLAISQVFFLLMAIHPEIQKKAQREIDQLLGGERLPTLADQGDLPYISALIKEIYRWHAPLPISIPKSLREDDVYKGYHLPKGATVMENVWAVFRDPVMYPQPHMFNPERFLKDGKLDPSVRDPDDRVFGSSRRICPGRYFANRTVFLRVATVLATFDIEPGVNEWGELPSEVKIHEGIVRHAALFKCLIKPRSEAALKLVRDAHHTVGSH
ncbi:CyP450 monooxygenase [Thelephora ganbajun]|uniref:CyP450 monooxygenase n=1 Tax=Thelephora ganbajun TaxID=370292 RepID=A0ACB6ZUJ7_THEGA|nr:CyP450 monooxygenase [Thelephora ganbajun]